MYPSASARALALAESKVSGGICAGRPGIYQTQSNPSEQYPDQREAYRVDAAILEVAVARVVRDWH